MTETNGVVSKEYLEGDLDGLLSTYAESVKKGCKPAACCTIYRHLVPRAIEILNADGLHFAVFPADDERATVYLFRDAALFNVIMFAQSPLADIDKQVGLWIYGKLFGYSDGDIVCYMEKWRPE